MDRLNHFLINVSKPELAQSNIYQVVGSAIRLTAANLTGREVVTIQVLVGDSSSNGVWQDLYRYGQPVQLTAIDNQLTEVVGGKYRVVYTGAADVKVWAETNDINLDKNVVYNYPASSGSSGGSSSLSVLDTNSVDLTLLANVLSADCKISADVGNSISIHADGLYSAGGGGGISGSGQATQVAYFDGATSITSNSNLYWDSVNFRLGIKSAIPSCSLHVVNSTSRVIYLDGPLSTGYLEVAQAGTTLGYFGYSSPGGSGLFSNGTNNATIVRGESAVQIGYQNFCSISVINHNVAINGGVSIHTVSTAANYIALTDDIYIGVTDTSVVRVVTLPAVASVVSGQLFKIKDESGAAATNNIVVTPQLGELIDGAASSPIDKNYGAMEVVMRNGAWWIT